ncbi:hypothetical protein HZA42_05165 [Candidatus Peregrinibacteria bacterium]|nr:hypothetical protein [Candidatus Peregrinibacteria bacterium]
MIALIVAPASGLYIANSRITAMNRNDLVAAGLADEGVEVMRNIRDTNLIKFSPKAKSCWNATPKFDSIDDCDKKANKMAQEVGEKHFKLTLDPETFDWDLEDGSADLSAGIAEEYRLKLDEATATNPECNPSGGGAQNCSAHTGLYFSPPRNAPQALNSRGSLSRFYRQIGIKYTTNGKAMKVTSTVKYMNGGSERTIKRAVILTNQPS